MYINKIENEVLARNIVPANTIIVSTEHIGWANEEKLRDGVDLDFLRNIFTGTATALGAQFIGERIVTGREIAAADAAAGKETNIVGAAFNKRYLVQSAY